MNICSTCQGAQSECQERLDAQHGVPRPRQRDARRPRGSRYEKGITNKHFLWLMVEEIGLDKIASMVKRPLTDLRIGPFYGCYIVRPTDRLGIDREHPRDTYLQQLIEALGGTVVDYAGQYKCCGFPIITMNKEASLKQAGRHLGDAIDADADCLVTPCPLCHLNLDLQQPLAEKVVGRPLGMPVLHLPADGRPRPRARPEGARAQQARRPAHLGDRLVDLGRRRRPGRRLTRTRHTPLAATRVPVRWRRRPMAERTTGRDTGAAAPTPCHRARRHAGR